MCNILYKFLLSTILIISFVNNSLAKTKFIGTHKDWTAYSNKEKNGKTCFIASEPLKSSGKYNKSNRGKTYVFVTNIKNGTSHEISVVAGFNYKKNTKVKFTIDKNTTLLFPIDDRAWSESPKVDKILVRKMKKGNKLTIEGMSSPGNKIIDHYSLSGFTKALSLIDKNCS
tara:strand:- start:533 stop:1045 length:513 start_codon:yes stop_codon:yes gene_type:complete